MLPRFIFSLHISANSSFVVFKQEEEWKKLLAEEVNSLERAIFEREEKISEQKVQIDELKKSFLYNYDLLKSRDAELLQYEQAISKLQTVQFNFLDSLALRSYLNGIRK